MKYIATLLLFLGLVAHGQTAPTVDTLAVLASRKPVTNSTELVWVKGFSTAGDWGGPRAYRYDQDNLEATNAVRLGVATGRGRWVHDWDGDIRAWGWSKSAAPAVNGAAFRAATAYTDSLTNGRPEIHIPSGAHYVDHLGSIVSTSITGDNWVDVGFDFAPTIIIQELGNTNDLLTLSSTNTSKPSVKNLWLYVAGQSGRRNEKAILGVTSRTSFIISTVDLPAVPPAPTTFPYYGYCFFYSSEGRYLGTGVVQSFDAGTGEIILQPNSDKYATRSGAGGLLTTTEKVIFSPFVTETPIFSGAPLSSSGPDPTRAGPVGIRVFSKGYAHIENVRVLFGHCGIVAGVANTGLQMHNVSCEWAKFAGVANIFPGSNSDSWNGRLRVGGFYIEDFGQAPETQTFVDVGFRNTYTGIYMPSYSSSFDDYLVYSTVHGVVGSGVYHVLGGVWMLDDILLDGIYWRDGNLLSTRWPYTLQVGNLTIRPVFQRKRPVYYTNTVAAFLFNGNQGVKVRVGQLGVDTVSVPGGTNLFDFLYDGSDQLAQSLSVAQYSSLTAVQNLYVPGKQRLMSDSWILRGSNTLASLNEQRLEVQQTNQGGYVHSIKNISDTSVGTGGRRWDMYVLANHIAYTHFTDGSVDHSPTNSGLQRVHRWRTEGGTNTAEVMLGWGGPTDSTLNIRGDQIFARSTSSTNTVAAPFYLQAGGGNVVVGDGSTSRLILNGADVLTTTYSSGAPILTLNSTNGTSGTVINNTGSSDYIFRIQGTGTTLWQARSNDWNTVGKTPVYLRYNGGIPQVGVTNINGAAVLYLIGVTP